MNEIKAYGIKYKIPEAHLLHSTPLFISEFAARTCYDSFNKSEHTTINTLNDILNSNDNTDLKTTSTIDKAHTEVNTKGSKLLFDLSHVYFHESTLEHVTLNFIIKNTSRGVLQELARHRIASYSVQSTRYTMSDLINWFNISINFNKSKDFFINKIIELDILISTDNEFNSIEIAGIYNKLLHQMNVIGQTSFLELTVAKSVLDDFKNSNSPEEAFKILSSKAKKNVGDVIKHIITDNFSVDLAFSINLRSLKNFFDLRLSGAAYWQMQILAYSIFKVIPETYLDLIVKDSKKEQFKRLSEKINLGIWG